MEIGFCILLSATSSSLCTVRTYRRLNAAECKMDFIILLGVVLYRNKEFLFCSVPKKENTPHYSPISGPLSLFRGPQAPAIFGAPAPKIPRKTFCTRPILAKGNYTVLFNLKPGTVLLSCFFYYYRPACSRSC